MGSRVPTSSVDMLFAAQRGRARRGLQSWTPRDPAALSYIIVVHSTNIVFLRRGHHIISPAFLLSNLTIDFDYQISLRSISFDEIQDAASEAPGSSEGFGIPCKVPDQETPY